MPITIYGRHTSYNVQKVLWLLDELAVKYQHIELGSEPTDTESDTFGRLNPMRKVPVLADGDQVVWESNTILRYLAKVYGSKQWQQVDAFQSSLVERWMDWSQTRFEPAFVGVFWGFYRTPAHLHDKESISKSIEDCVDCLSKLDDQLADKNFLLGGTLSLADITNGIFLYRLDQIDLDVPLPRKVKDWYQRLQNSDGYQHWGMSDFSSLQGRLQY